MTDETKRFVNDLRICAKNGNCDECSYRNAIRTRQILSCWDRLAFDTADMIEHQSTEQDALVLEIERLRKELEAAKKDIKNVLETYWLQFTTTPCEFCKHAEDKQRESICFQCGRKLRFFSENWEWRGLCAENGGENND